VLSIVICFCGILVNLNPVTERCLGYMVRDGWVGGIIIPVMR
jgi:hypothetical protein